MACECDCECVCMVNVKAHQICVDPNCMNRVWKHFLYLFSSQLFQMHNNYGQLSREFNKLIVRISFTTQELNISEYCLLVCV